MASQKPLCEAIAFSTKRQCRHPAYAGGLCTQHSNMEKNGQPIQRVSATSGSAATAVVGSAGSAAGPSTVAGHLREMASRPGSSAVASGSGASPAKRRMCRFKSRRGRRCCAFAADGQLCVEHCHHLAPATPTRSSTGREVDGGHIGPVPNAIRSSSDAGEQGTEDASSGSDSGHGSSMGGQAPPTPAASADSGVSSSVGGSLLCSSGSGRSATSAVAVPSGPPAECRCAAQAAPAKPRVAPYAWLSQARPALTPSPLSLNCRRGKGPWGYNSAELQHAPVRVEGEARVAGVNGSSDDRPSKSWLHLYGRVCQQDAGLAVCCAAGCPAAAGVGGHLWVFDAEQCCYDKRHCYIAPVCSRHNGRHFDYPKLGFQLKRGTWLMRIVPHECYTDYQLDVTFA